jgi:hypothetical protein
VRLLPVTVEGQSDPHFILVATRNMPCIDEKAPRTNCASTKPRRDAPGCFAARGEGPLIVSGEIEDALEEMGATGTRFEEV